MPTFWLTWDAAQALATGSADCIPMATSRLRTADGRNSTLEILHRWTDARTRVGTHSCAKAACWDNWGVRDVPVFRARTCVLSY